MTSRTLLLLALTAAGPATAQELPAESEAARTKALLLYQQQAASAAALYNGPLHFPYLVLEEGVPYLQSNEWDRGDVLFDGMLYRNLRLKLDLVADRLVVQHPELGIGVEPVRERIAYFTLGGRRFRYEQDSASLPAGPGFYEVVGAGATEGLIRRKKFVENRIQQERLMRNYTERVTYLVRTPQGYRTVRNERDLLSALGAPPALRTSLRRSGLRFRKSPEATFRAALLFVQPQNTAQ